MEFFKTNGNTDPSVYEQQQDSTYPTIVDYKPKFGADADSSSSNASLLFQFIKSLRIGTDLSQIASPIQGEKGKSALEWGAELSRPFESFTKAHKETDALKRMIHVLQFIVAPRTSVPQPSITGPNKPYNSVIGEHFHGHWNHSDNSQSFVVYEQISHHPPVCCFYIWNQTNNFSYEGTIRTAPIFWGNKVDVTFTGPIRVHLFLPSGVKETYHVSLPSPCAKGILLGKSGFEFSGEAKIVCEQTGVQSNLKFKSGNVFKGHITEPYEKVKKNGTKKMKSRPVYEIEGSMIGLSHITDLRNNDKQVFLDVMSMEDLQLVVKPVAKQDCFESRRIWHHVTHAIKQKDWDSAIKHKAEVEESQRKLIKEMKANHEEYVPKYFKKTDVVVDKMHLYEYLHPITHYTAPIESTVDDLDLD